MNPLSTTSAETPLRFVVLHHVFSGGAQNGRADHFDLMLEQESRLATWAIDKLPELGETVSAIRLPDHRKKYLDYEGPISGDRGSVKRMMAGTYRVDQRSRSCLNVLLSLNDECISLQILSNGDASNSASATIRRVELVADGH